MTERTEAVKSNGEKVVTMRFLLGFSPSSATLGSRYISWCLEVPPDKLRGEAPDPRVVWRLSVTMLLYSLMGFWALFVFSAELPVIRTTCRSLSYLFCLWTRTVSYSAQGVSWTAVPNSA